MKDIKFRYWSDLDDQWFYKTIQQLQSETWGGQIDVEYQQYTGVNGGGCRVKKPLLCKIGLHQEVRIFFLHFCQYECQRCSNIRQSRHGRGFCNTECGHE